MTNPTPPIRLVIYTTESDAASNFDVDEEQVRECVVALRDPNAVLELRSGSLTAYIPVRNIAYMSTNETR